MTILLTILKVIGILLLVILGLILAIVLLVLFAPVRYRAEGAYQEKFVAKGRATWLFHLLSVRFSFDGAFSYSVKIAGIRFLPKRQKKKAGEAVAAAEADDDKQERGGSVSATEGGGQERSGSSDLKDGDGQEHCGTAGLADDSVQERVGNAEAENSADADGRTARGAAPGGCSEAEEPPAQKDLFDFLEKLLQKVYAIFRKCGEKYEAICVKIEKVKKKSSYYIRLLKREETKELLHLVFSQIQGVLKHLLPRRLDVCLCVGTGAPASTGQILALAGVLYPLLGGNVCVVPDFEEKRFEGTFYMKGRITAFVLLLCALRVAVNKNFRKLIGILRKKEEA